MGVCFVGEVGMKDFLKEYIDTEPGEIREAESKKVLGYHEGAIFYTIGQRHGLYLSGEKGKVNDGLPYYVVKKDIKKNIVYVSKNLNHEAIWTNELKLRDIFLRQVTLAASNPFATTSVNGDILTTSKGEKKQSNGLAVQVRLRHRAPLVPATFDGKTLYFENKIKRPANGQSAVLYNGEICLGGGIIA